MNGAILGWDVGGANIKAVRLEVANLTAGGRAGEWADTPTGPSLRPAVVERPFGLWREPDRLASVLAEVADALGGARRMALTMTAELADCFATKRDGVAHVLDAFRAAFPETEPRVFGVDGRFRSPTAARRAPLRVAAANWAATAHLAARTDPDALVIDVGTTTTDIIPVVGGRVAARGRTDPARLRSGELVYTGVLRTPVDAIVRRVPLGSGWCRVAAERFAVAGDVYLWLRRIRPRDYTGETPDGRGVRRRDAAARLARVVCADLELLAPRDVSRIARCIARAQRRQIVAAIRQVLRRLGPAAPRTALIAGRGGFLGRAAATAAGLEAVSLAARIGAPAARVAPAAAVAWLLAEAEAGAGAEAEMDVRP